MVSPTKKGRTLMIAMFLGIHDNSKNTNSDGANDMEIQFGRQVPHSSYWINHYTIPMNCPTGRHYVAVSYHALPGYVERHTRTLNGLTKGRTTLGTRVGGCPALPLDWHPCVATHPGVFVVDVTAAAAARRVTSPSIPRASRPVRSRTRQPDQIFEEHAIVRRRRVR
jgi:hypothetical protein